MKAGPWVCTTASSGKRTQRRRPQSSSWQWAALQEKQAPLGEGSVELLPARRAPEGFTRGVHVNQWQKMQLQTDK